MGSFIVGNPIALGCALLVLHSHPRGGMIPCECPIVNHFIIFMASSIGHFILWEAPHGKTKKLYPAEIISRSAQSPLVILRWYSGNQLPAKLKSKDFQVPVSACIKAFFCDIGQSVRVRVYAPGEG